MRVARTVLGFMAVLALVLATAPEAFAAGAAPQPSICTRSCWSARSPRSYSYMSGLNRAVIHHTAGTGDYNTSSLSASAALVRGIQNYHMDSNGWSDIGYNFLFDKLGNAFEGRYNSMSQNTQGAHDAVNYYSFGFSCMGYFHPPYNQSFTSAMRSKLCDVIAWRMPNPFTGYGAGTYNGKTCGYICGHRDVASTACPGDGVAAYIGSNYNGGTIRDSVYDRIEGNVSNWQDLGGGLTSGPDAVCWGPNRIDVFVRGGSNVVYQKYYDGGGVWPPYVSKGGYATSDPSVSSWGENRLDVFVKGAGDNLEHIWYNGTWGSWENLGGTLTSAPDAVSWGSGRIDVVVRGGSNKIYWKYYIAGQGWLPDGHFEDLGGYATSNPSICSYEEGRLDVFCRGSDNTLHHKWYDNGSWSAWESLGGVLTSGPDAVSWGPGRIDVVVRGGSNKIYHKYWIDGTGWLPSGSFEDLGGYGTSDPTICSWEPRRLDVFVRGNNNTLEHKWFDGEDWHP